MANSVTKWKRGSHTVANGGKNFSSMARECSMTWDSSTDPIYSPIFDWVVDHDFTIIINVDAVATRAGNGLNVIVQGSGTGASALAEWDDLGTFSNVGEHSQTKFEMYDFDTNGRAPFMRLKCDPDHASGHNATVKFYIIPHVT